MKFVSTIKYWSITKKWLTSSSRRHLEAALIFNKRNSSKECFQMLSNKISTETMASKSAELYTLLEVYSSSMTRDTKRTSKFF